MMQKERGTMMQDQLKIDELYFIADTLKELRKQYAEMQYAIVHIEQCIVETDAKFQELQEELKGGTV